MMKVLSDFSRAADALQRIAASLTAAAGRQLDSEIVMERLMDLERQRTMWEADVEGLLAKAEGKLKAAANSEARERTMQRKREADFDPFGPYSEEEGEPVPENDAEVGYQEGLLPVPVGLEAVSPRQQRLRAKFS